MKVLICGEKQDKTYEEICHELGFIPETKFVKVTSSGRIGFTAGKRDEIRELFRAILRNGYTASKGLKQTIHNIMV